MHTVLFLGAGFSVPAGLPSARDLFSMIPPAHSQRAEADIKRTLTAWETWHMQNPTAPAEEFISNIYEQYRASYYYLWPILVRFLAYQLATPFAKFYQHDGKTSRAYDNIFTANTHSVHTEWWNAVLTTLSSESKVTVITTNWDILIEQALRPQATRGRQQRPGFHYGYGIEDLKATTGFPKSKWVKNPVIGGSVPVLKLHGSLNWSIESGKLVKYGDLRPAFRGDAAIVPPIKEKAIPEWAIDIWNQATAAMNSADCILAVGYSFPEYDTLVWDLFRNATMTAHAPVHIFNGSAKDICCLLQRRIPGITVSPHPRLPEGIKDVVDIIQM